MSKISTLTVQQIRQLGYVDFMALLDETNRPPGGLRALISMLQASFLTPDSRVLDVGCNTGFCTFEISRFAKCNVTGVDINENMIATATKNKSKYLDKKRSDKVTFKVGDAKSLDFPDSSFDLVMSGGSTAFVDDIPAAIREYSRVCKDYGLICDINFYYHKAPPTELLKKMNDTMGTNIEPWGSNYWENIYRNAGLEFISITRIPIEEVTDEKVEHYAREMSGRLGIGGEATKAVATKLLDVMKLFNENHKYLASGVFLYRKNPSPYEVTLF